MEDILLLNSIERYLEGQMLPDEKSFFEELRRNRPEVDQMVVMHAMDAAIAVTFLYRCHNSTTLPVNPCGRSLLLISPVSASLVWTL